MKRQLMSADEITRPNRSARRLGQRVCALCAIVLSACVAQPVDDEAVYQVEFIGAEPVLIDGALNEPFWANAPFINPEIHAPWTSGPSQETKFQAAWDGTHLYYAFLIEDEDPVTLDAIDEELDIGNEDRVELFIADIDIVEADGSCELKRYYGLEVDFAGRVLDFLATPYRQFYFGWDSATHSASSSHKDGAFVVEGKIELSELNLESISRMDDTGSSPTKLQIGVFRGDFSSNPEAQPEWLSWVDPQTEDPDFHVCSAFGTFVF